MSQSTPYFSLLFPAYNAQGTVARALESVLAQDFDDWELIAVDDGSTDGTLELLRAYAARDERITVIAQANAGCAAARAVAQQAAHGNYLVKFDADDRLEPHWARAMVHAIEAHPHADFISCNGLLVTYDDTGVPTAQRPYVTSPRFKSETSLTLADIMEEPYILGGGSVAARSLIEKSGGYQSGPRAEDFDFWVRAFLAGAQHVFIPQTLYLYTKGLEGQMNEDQTVSYASFVESIDSALKRPDLSRQQRALLHRGRVNYIKRTHLAYYEMSAINNELTSQSERFYEALTSIFPAPAARLLFKGARLIKKPIDPLRIAWARKKEERKTRG